MEDIPIPWQLLVKVPELVLFLPYKSHKPSGNGLFHTPLYNANYKIAAEDNKICINKSRCNIVPEEGIKECLYNWSKNELLNSITFSSIQTGHLVAATISQLKMKNMELLFKVSPNELRDLAYPTKSKSQFY